MKRYVYVDNSNVFIEGQRVAAVKRGFARNIFDAMNTRTLDDTWNIDYGSLYATICETPEEIGGAHLWGSPPPGDSFWNMVKSHGFNVKYYERGPSGEKKVDVAIAHRMTKDAYTVIEKEKSSSAIILVSGDKDFVPAVEDLKEEGFLVIVAFWSHAARELRETASAFFDLDPHHATLTRRFEPPWQT